MLHTAGAPVNLAGQLQRRTRQSSITSMKPSQFDRRSSTRSQDGTRVALSAPAPRPLPVKVAKMNRARREAMSRRPGAGFFWGLQGSSLKAAGSFGVQWGDSGSLIQISSGAGEVFSTEVPNRNPLRESLSRPLHPFRTACAALRRDSWHSTILSKSKLAGLVRNSIRARGTS